jgi:transposase
MTSRKKKQSQSADDSLAALRENAAGIDVGATEHWVSVPPNRDSEPVRRFATFTPDLKVLADWLNVCGIKTVAMESTGVYWIPLFEMLEERGFEVHLVNARQLKNVAGRKTDWTDCQWIRVVHTYGLLSASFRPPEQIVALRAYLRHRKMLVEYASNHVRHMQKALMQMNLQLHHVLSDITGVTASRIIEAILKGERDAQRLAESRDGRVKNSVETIAKALDGNYRAEHVFALKQAYDLYQFYRKQIDDCDQHMQQQSTALQVLSEIGTDVGAWKTEKHFASWLNLSPNHRISGGKILDRKTRNHHNRTRDALRMSAQSLLNSQSALGAYCRRVCARIGHPKGIIATAHKLACLIYRLLKFGGAYLDKGQEYYEKRYKERVVKNIARHAKQHGFQLVPISNVLVP